MKHKLIILTGLAIFLVLFLNSAWAGKNDIYIIEVVDAISPGVAEFIKDGIETAEKEGAACIIIALDTPGGLAESMRMIIQNILGSKVPVVVYVSPASEPGAKTSAARCRKRSLTIWLPMQKVLPKNAGEMKNGWKKPFGKVSR
jgi:membrane-bound serine protease (ClpP class)